VGRAALALALVAAIGAAGCRSRSAAGEGPYADKVATYVPQIERAIGVKYKTPPRIEVRSRQQVREFLLQKFNEPEVQKAIGTQGMTNKLLGLIPDTMNLPAFFVRVLTEQIIGYYDPGTKVLYVVDGAPEEYVGITIVHELVHALQDQYINLDSLQHLAADDDRQAAVQAVIEGQANYEELVILAGRQGTVQIPGGWEQIREAIRDAQATQPVFSSAPTVIQESLLFPYINGSEFIKRFHEQRSGGLPWDHFPVSTEQVMHESAYFGSPADIPSVVTLPPVPGKLDENDMGEFGTRLFLYQHLHEPGDSTHASTQLAGRASIGWDGDRFVLAKTAEGNALAWVTVWDTPVDAAEFVSTIDDVMRAWRNVRPVVAGGVRRFSTAKRTTEISTRDMNGRTAVLYVDVPAGTSTALLDFSKVSVTPR
jgi:hypothetical protein